MLTGDLCNFLPSLLQSPAQYFAAAGALRSLHAAKISEGVQWFLLEFSGCWLPAPARLSQTQPPEGRANEGQKSTSRGLRVSVWALGLLPDLKTHWVLGQVLMRYLGSWWVLNVTSFTQKPIHFDLGLKNLIIPVGSQILFTDFSLRPRVKKAMDLRHNLKSVNNHVAQPVWF